MNVYSAATHVPLVSLKKKKKIEKKPTMHKIQVSAAEVQISVRFHLFYQ